MSIHATVHVPIRSELDTPSTCTCPDCGAALQDVPAWGVGTGVNDLGLGARLRYEVHRKVAPYVGYNHHWSFGETAELAGDYARSGAFVFDVRIWR